MRRWHTAAVHDWAAHSAVVLCKCASLLTHETLGLAGDNFLLTKRREQPAAVEEHARMPTSLRYAS